MSTKTPARIFASIGACVFPLAAFGAQTPKSAKATVAPAGSVQSPFIVHNPDGTFTVQTAPARGKQGAARKGLVIPPQVVVPELRLPASSSSTSSRGH